MKNINQQRRHANGLCLQCVNKIENGKTLCDNCLLRANNRSKQRKAVFKKMGLCSSCGKIEPIIGYARCGPCIEKDRCRRLKLRNNMQRDGTCVICGKRQVVPGNAKCELCYLRHNANRYLGSGKRWKELKDLFDKQSGLCAISGRKLMIGVNAEIDHVVPRARGGENVMSNYQWVFTNVNRLKSDYLMCEFKEIISEIHGYLSQKSFS